MKKRLFGDAVGVFAVGCLVGVLVFVAMLVWGLKVLDSPEQGWWKLIFFHLYEVDDYFGWYWQVGVFASLVVVAVGFLISVIVLLVRLRRQKRVQAVPPESLSHHHWW